MAEVPPSIRITALDLSGNNIGDQGVIALAGWIEDSHLDSLGFIGPGITARGLAILGESMKKLKMDRLTLKNSNLGGKDIAFFLAQLGNTMLRYLNLNDNKLGDRGVSQIATVLKDLSIPKILMLANNNIGDRGATALAAMAQALAGRRDIEVDLRYNPISQQVFEMTEDMEVNIFF